MTTIVSSHGTTSVAANTIDDLWLSRDDVTLATGWTLKPEGFCKDDTCIPIPRSERAAIQRGTEVNISALWRLMGRPVVASDAKDVWVLGEGAADRNEELLSLQAPDFTLPDFEGQPVSLHDFRRKRILLITWASW